MICKCCNAQVEYDSKFCPICGMPLVEEAPVEEAPIEETPVEEAPVEETPVEEAPVEEAPETEEETVEKSGNGLIWILLVIGAGCLALILFLLAF